MCWPQTGHANLSSLIGSVSTIPYGAARDKLIVALLRVESLQNRNASTSRRQHEEQMRPRHLRFGALSPVVGLSWERRHPCRRDAGCGTRRQGWRGPPGREPRGPERVGVGKRGRLGG